jgi:hypothetical protein
VQQNLLLGTRVTTARSRKSPAKQHFALLAQLVEHFHGNERVPGSSRAAGSLRVAEDPGRAGDSATIDMRASVHEVPWVATTAG